MRTKETSVQRRKAIIRLKNQTNERAKNWCVAKSVVWYILKKNECTGQQHQKLEHSQEGRHIIIKPYNQEMSSRMEIK